jgi:transcriptional regulator with XRE-family HTH domain
MRCSDNESQGEKGEEMNINENIKRARKEAGLSQKELAERLQVYQKDISRWENGERTPSLEAFARICRELNCSADNLLELNQK